MMMGVLGWIVLGTTAGCMASTLVSKRMVGLRVNIALGILGALFGGEVYCLFAAAKGNDFNLWSLVAAGGGAGLLVLAGNIVRRPAWQG